MKKSLSILIIVSVLAVITWRIISEGSGVYLGTPEILGGVVRSEDNHGERLYYLTSQWEKRTYTLGGGRSSYSTKTESWLNIDLWTLDAATAQPVSRKRIKREKVNADAKAMGLEQGVLWARIPELVGIRLSDGVVVADRGKIAAKNPALAGLLPSPPRVGIFLTDSMQPLKFDPQSGLVVRLDDARLVRIDPLTLEATQVSAETDKRSASATAEEAAEAKGTPMAGISNGMDWRAMVRGLTMVKPDGSGQWLGLLSDTDVETMRSIHSIGGQMDFSVPQRQKMFRAKLSQVKEFLGPRTEFAEPEVLPESPDFLMAGLLTEASGASSGQSALWMREPDSVFVLSRDRLGENGRLPLARITGPLGKPAWSTALPLSQMSVWVPSERFGLMLGPDASAARSPLAEEGENPIMQVVSINLETGEVRSFNPDLHRDWPVDGEPPAK